MSDKGLDEKLQEHGGKGFGEGEQVREEFGVENEVREGEESYSVEDDGEKMLESSSNKRVKEMSIDRLSALPDSLIIHILSLLGVKEAAMTSLLSKRWQFLWADLPSLEFRESSSQTEKIRKLVALVHRALATRSGSYLERFWVNFKYDERFASDVDAWVEFAVKNKVKEVILLLDSDEDFYMLPEMMYSNSSLTRLWLRGCIMAPERTIEWQSLTSLDIQEVELPQHVIEKILSSSPVLYRLNLRACWGFSCLEVNSRSLYVLRIADSEDVDSGPLLEISAPYIHCLKIWLYPEGRKLRLTNIPSHATASINFTGYDWDAASVEVMSNTKELFENIQHVKELDVGRRCFEVLSMLAVNGWQLPQLRQGCLTVNTLSSDEHNMSGILGLLESSPNLETLVIDGFEASEESITWSPPAKDDLDCDLLHLKTVKIRNFAEPSLAGDPMLMLARILLKRATVLEEMVILTDVEDTSDFMKIGQTLLTYPRSSPNAVVLLP